MHTQARAKLSIEYIKSTYLNNMGNDLPNNQNQQQKPRNNNFGPQPG